MKGPIEIVFTANRVAPSDFHPESWDDVYGEGAAYNIMLFEDYLQSYLYDKTVNDYLLKYFGY